jgi:hypothetical protein
MFEKETDILAVWIRLDRILRGYGLTSDSPSLVIDHNSEPPVYDIKGGHEAT